MIQSILISDKKIKDVLLFDKLEDIRKINLLFGGNGVGKTTLLKSIREGRVTLKTKGDILIKSYTNSIENAKININKELINTRDFVKAVNVSSFSEGQSIIHYVLSFLYDIKEIATDKSIVVLLDEIDSGLSAENINMLLWTIKELVDTKNVQFFISTNHYHFVYALKNVLNMYDGTYIQIDTYEEYFKLLNEGVFKMKESNKRNFDFLNTY